MMRYVRGTVGGGERSSIVRMRMIIIIRMIIIVTFSESSFPEKLATKYQKKCQKFLKGK